MSCAEAGDAEVADLHRAVGEPHDVGGLQVAVHDALLVGVGEGGGDLVGDLDDVAHGQRVLLVVLQELAEVAALQELHDQVEDAVGLAEVVDDGDPAVLEGGGHPGLAAEAFPQDPGEGLVVVRAQRLEALHGDMTAQRLVARTPHLAHAAAPDQVEQPVPALDQPAVPHLLRSPPSLFAPPSPARPVWRPIVRVCTVPGGSRGRAVTWRAGCAWAGVASAHVREHSAAGCPWHAAAG